MSKKTICIGVSALTIAFAEVALAANTIIIKGPFGDVTFPHKAHQNRQKNCEPCHTLFAKAPGSIGKAIAAGTFKSNTVMEMCIDCHEAKKAKGEAAGPVECRECHKK